MMIVDASKIHLIRKIKSVTVKLLAPDDQGNSESIWRRSCSFSSVRFCLELGATVVISPIASSRGLGSSV